MIPKIVHYCWFGKGEKSDIIKKCMETWKRNCPDYEFMEWNETNFDVNMCEFTKGAYENKKWAFVSDVDALPLAAVLISFVGTELMMYLYHTPRPDVLGVIGGSYVEGAQGRYFIPLFLPVLMALSNGWIARAYGSKKKGIGTAISGIHKSVSYVAVFGAIMCGAYTILIVLLRYWI